MKDDTKLVQSADQLERVLEDLQQIERFEPPAGFAAQARVRDMGAYEAAERDPEGYWAEQARAAALGSAVHHGAGRLQPAVLQVVRGRDDQRLLQLS